ncbi:aminoglycoside phosphotransferase family protein [Chryseobacterium sp. MP_3.2]|uniref:aminoglycoside phosphotransferase family protein n=1 Tax=Chryseobacterium sp. MP_3.2 TaxID=3071712 RepID=UPI002DFAFE3D|nr:aminoglycoside/choline kinase family phosphotransferase [Chryseobacterium sp. MP_3.2]
MEDAQHFFEEYIGEKAENFKILAQSGSARINFVGESSTQKYIITSNENLAENESFFYFSQIFSDLKLNSPEIFAISNDRKIYAQEFLGGNTLSDLIEKEGLSDDVKFLVQATLEKLFALQHQTINQIDYSKTFEYEKYDDLPITNDLFYFKSFIIDVLEISYQKSILLKEFKIITSLLENLQPQGLMIRDFQARNIMVNDDNEVHFIDYQSAMKGPLMYDVVSFLFQAKANFPAEFRAEMLTYYYSLWEKEADQISLKESLEPLQLIRFLQVLGAYGFRGLIQRKRHFLASLEKGIENLVQLSETWDKMSDFPEMTKLIGELQTVETKEKIEKLLK